MFNVVREDHISDAHEENREFESFEDRPTKEIIKVVVVLGPSEEVILVDPVLDTKKDQNNGEAKRDQVGVEEHSVDLNKIVGVSFSQIELFKLSILVDSRLDCIVEPWSTSYG